MSALKNHLLLTEEPSALERPRLFHLWLDSEEDAAVTRKRRTHLYKLSRRQIETSLRRLLRGSRL